MPSFAGRGGQCILDPEGQWQCFTTADGLPFDDIRAYGIVQDSNVEWFMSAKGVASQGMSPQDQLYSIPELVGDEGARPTWLSVPYSQQDSVWVGTDGHGLLRIEPDKGRVTRYTRADGLPDDTVRDVQAHEDSAWVATAGGVGQWDGVRWRVYTTRDGLPSDDVRGVAFARSWMEGFEGVWAATADGPALLVAGREDWQRFPDFPQGVEVNGVAGGVFSTRGQGLVRFMQAPVARGRTTTLTVDDGLPDDQITALAATANGLLVGTPRGAVEGDGRTWTLITGAAVNDANSGAIATEEGLWVWEGSVWEQVSDERATLVAEHGWYATPSQVCRWVDGASHCPTTFDGRALAGVQVLYTIPGWQKPVAIDPQGRGWTFDTQACSPGCLVTPDPLSDLSENAAPRQVNDLVVMMDKWLCAADEGVYDASYSGGCDPFAAFGDLAPAGGWPLAVRRMSLEGTMGQVWIATAQGAFYADAEGRWTYVDGLVGQSLSAVLALPGGEAWFGTEDAGLIRFERE
jgi:hypothetical protein